MNTFSDILYLTNFIKYCFSVIYSFFLYLNFNQVSSVESNGERKQESGEPHGKSMAETL